MQENEDKEPSANGIKENTKIKSWCSRDFLHPSRPALEPTQPHLQRVPGPFTGDNAAGVWGWPPTPSSDEVKERVELYL